MIRAWLLAVAIGALVPVSLEAQLENRVDEFPAIGAFLGADGFGMPHPAAPPETLQFGALAGIWLAQQEVRGRDGEWVSMAPALWVWKYSLGGFAVQDLWYQPEDGLPVYLADLGHDYALTALRVYDARESLWRVGWAASGGGRTPGSDFGTLAGRSESGDIVLDGPGLGDTRQRVVFSGLTSDTFTWTSLFSNDDGTSWQAAMRVQARRLR